MKLAAMRYKDYVWPHNPRTYTIDYQRNVTVQKVPFGRYHLQDLGLTRRVMRGEGEFAGEGAYDEFKRLASVFYLPGPGPLIHPVWQAAEVYFVALSLQQEPRADYVAYSFTFWESSTETGTQAGTLPTSNAGSGTACGCPNREAGARRRSSSRGTWVSTPDRRRWCSGPEERWTSGGASPLTGSPWRSSSPPRRRAERS